MKAIRKDEIVDDVHSLFVEQLDWEKIISKDDRTIDYLKDTVKSIYKALRQTLIFVKQKYKYITVKLPKSIFFITSQDLEDIYPDKTPKEREELFVKDHKAVFIIGTGVSRILLFLLEKSHIAEIQASSWDKKTLQETKNKKIL